MKTKTLLHWHKRLSWLVLAASFLWISSGVMHPLMSMLRPRPAQFRAPVQSFDPAAIRLPTLQGQWRSCRIVVYEGQPYWQLTTTEGKSQYLHALTGKELQQGDERYALLLGLL